MRERSCGVRMVKFRQFSPWLATSDIAAGKQELTPTGKMIVTPALKDFAARLGSGIVLTGPSKCRSASSCQVIRGAAGKFATGNCAEWLASGDSSFTLLWKT